MNQQTLTFAQRLQALNQKALTSTLNGIKHGVEREGLRIEANGRLATTPHPQALGSALTHDSITTDFSESLLEFITPPENQVEKTLAQLGDIHKFTLSQLGDERLWPLSMPCYVNSGDDIPIAQYGSSNIAKMKTLYRLGLKNRYGSMMQAISGVHFNFSLPDEFWLQWLALMGQDFGQQQVSAAYFSLLRNYRRFCWLIPYLYGASPALCGSFIKHKPSSLPFKVLGKGTYYLPYATSLRMSDLGYTNSAQSSLAVCYNQLDSYIASLRQAISTPSAQYARFNGKVAGAYQQLNANILQIENELYSPVRPKQPTLPLEKPTQALDSRGVSYIEVRALDVNPYSPVGIEPQQFYFLDTLLLYCAVADSPYFDANSYQQTEANLTSVVLRGREPGLQLQYGDQAIGLSQWAKQIFTDLAQLANVLDQANNSDKYSQAVTAEWKKIADPEQTYSGRMLKHMLQHDMDNGDFGLALAANYKQQLQEQDYQLWQHQDFTQMATASLLAQKQIEEQDSQSFEQFLHHYFSQG